jgi:hypothetical protein
MYRAFFISHTLVEYSYINNHRGELIITNMKKIITLLLIANCLFVGSTFAATEIPWSSRGGPFINPDSKDGVCGSYHERAFSKDLTMSMSDKLCSAGQATDLKLDGQWTWKCHVDGGTDAHCRAGKIPLTQCGGGNGKSFTRLKDLEAAGLCATGKATPVMRDSNDDFIWACEPLNGESSNVCRAKNSGQCGYLDGITMWSYSENADLRDSFSSSRKMSTMLCKDKKSVPVVKNGNTFQWTCGSTQCSAIDIYYEMEKRFNSSVYNYSGEQSNPETMVLHGKGKVTEANYGAKNISNYDIVKSDKSGTLYLVRKDLSRADGVCGESDYYRWAMTDLLSPSRALCKKGLATTMMSVSGQRATWTCEGIKGGKNIDCIARDRYYFSEVSTPSGIATDEIVTTNLCRIGRAFAYKVKGVNWSYYCIPLKVENGQDEFNEEDILCNGYEACGLGGIINKKTFADVICGTLYSTINKPDQGLCSKGDPTEVTVYKNGKAWIWNCLSPNRDGNNVSCYVEKLLEGQEIGLCGPSNGKTFPAVPTTGLCQSGIPTEVTFTAPDLYKWGCKGINGANNAWCQAKKGNGTTCNWNCGNWGSCVNGVQTRTCTSSPVGCSGDNPYPTTQQCGSSKINGVCGSSNGQSFSTKPTTNLCSTGTASSVTGTGPWNWTCNGSNGGTNASCSANKTGTPINGQCGSSNGQSFSAKPITGLCNSGTATSINGNGPWYWSCIGSGGGTDADCSANKKTDSCEWTCTDWSDCLGGKKTRTCTIDQGCSNSNPPQTVTDCGPSGLSCGSSSGGNFLSKPSTGLCVNGASMIVVDGGKNWYWICKDDKSDDAILCFAKKGSEKVDGQCGPSNGQALSSAPSTGLCDKGVASPVYGNGPWIWLCNGIGEGKLAVCYSAKK